ncbi:membrane protein [Rathayibacter toxicus]|nr:membrane protein [Rathayibacter toxicus]
MVVGAILAFAALIFGFWGFLVTAVFMALGVVIARILDGSVDFRSLVDAFRGRTTSR